ncbi:MAG TPA: ribosome small subunit-dependent GTPase A [Candidatus Latescibacteria bacterium]|nr:ribosome small subunit-dependent GTPase A [Candidatus Latescibacterota bacterium]
MIFAQSIVATSMCEASFVGTVIRKHRNFYVVERDATEVLCSLSSKLRKNLEYPEADISSRRRRVQAVHKVGFVDPVVVGDDVRVEPGAGIGLIVERLERQSTLSREAPSRTHLQQVIAANVDQVLAVVSPQSPPFRPDLLDRLLAGCEHHNLKGIVCLTKIDLGVPGEVGRVIETYPGIGYPVIRTSAVTGDGLQDLEQLLAGRNTVAVGLSGTGKSSLVNALVPGANLPVGHVNRKTGLGTHRTTTISLHRLASGGHLVDAPGLRELGLWDCSADQLPDLFPEFRNLVDACRFRGCAHRDEPGCAVKTAVEENAIAHHRYRNYLSIRAELERREQQG